MSHRRPCSPLPILVALLLVAHSAVAQRIPTTAAALPRYDLKLDYRSQPLQFDVSGTITLPAVQVDRSFVELSLGEAMGDVKFSGVTPEQAIRSSSCNERTIYNEAHALHQPAAFTCLPLNTEHPPWVESGAPSYNAQFAHLLPGSAALAFAASSTY
jgi:hypothetical protein